MRSTAPDLDPAHVRSTLAERGCSLGASRSIHIASETTSTNDDAKAGAREGAPHGSVWIAESQSRGRGRQGRAWISPPGENLLFTVLLRIACAPIRVPLISLVTGLAVRDAVAKAMSKKDVDAGGAVKVKWPNDVVVVDAAPNGSMQKIAGILVESSLSGSKVEHVVVGVGVNVHTREFPEDVRSVATSIALLLGTGGAREAQDLDLDRAEILADILARLDHDVEHVAHRGLGLIHARLMAHDALADRAINTDFEDIQGIACGIDLDGRLLVRRGDGTIVRVASGEVRVRVGAGTPARVT